MRQPWFVVLAFVLAMASAAAGVLVGVRAPEARDVRSFTAVPPAVAGVAGAVFELHCPAPIPGRALEHTPNGCAAELRELGRR